MSSTPNQNTDKSTPIAKANNEFGLRLLKDIAKDGDKNIFTSPLSISSAFGMLYAGADGESAQELRHGLGYEFAQLSDQMIHKEFKNILKVFDDPKYNLYVANRVIIEKTFKVEELYQNTVLDNYNVSVFLADFRNNIAACQGCIDTSLVLNTWHSALTTAGDWRSEL